VRVLARAAVLARDMDAQTELRQWLARTGYQDALLADILDAHRRGTVSP
jgi:hypothetical protein